MTAFEKRERQPQLLKVVVNSRSPRVMETNQTLIVQWVSIATPIQK